MAFYPKFQVFIAFAFRLPLVIFSSAHLRLFKQYLASSKPQLGVSASLVLRQAMLTYSLISATFPNLKSFMKSFSMGMGMPLPSKEPNGSYPNEFRLHTLRNASSRSRGLPLQGFPSIRIHWGQNVAGQQDRTVYREDYVAPENPMLSASDGDADNSNGKTENEWPVSRCGSQDIIIGKDKE